MTLNLGCFKTLTKAFNLYLTFFLNIKHTKKSKEVTALCKPSVSMIEVCKYVSMIAVYQTYVQKLY